MFENYLFPILIITGAGVLASLILVIASKFMAVKVDEKVLEVRAALPGANCGACGYAGCDEYAAKVAAGEAAPNLCVPGGAGVIAAISGIMGVEAGAAAQKAAIVRCGGNCEASPDIMDYQGPKTCAACNSYYLGKKGCNYACIGFGDCALVCPYGAICIEDGVAVVDREKCVGCGLCAKACPKGIISVVDASSQLYVACSNKDKGAVTRKLCSAGCIGCRLCERNCPSGAITVEDNLAVIDPEKCTNCGICKTKCPTGAIKTYLTE